MSVTATQTAAPAAPPAASTPAPEAATAPAPAPSPAAPAPAPAPAAPAPSAPAETSASTEAAPAEKAADTAAPADFELKFPEGVKVDTALVDSFKALAKETGMAPESAQKLADLYLEGQQRLATQRAEAFEAQQKAWEAELRADKDMGGQAFDANVGVARRAIERFGSPALKQLLNETGLGNHPELARFALRVGRALAEDSVAGASAASQATQSEDAVLAALYPSMVRKDR